MFRAFKHAFETVVANYAPIPAHHGQPLQALIQVSHAVMHHHGLLRTSLHGYIAHTGFSLSSLAPSLTHIAHGHRVSGRYGMYASQVTSQTAPQGDKDHAQSGMIFPPCGMQDCWQRTGPG